MFFFKILALFHISKHFWKYQTLFSKKNPTRVNNLNLVLGRLIANAPVPPVIANIQEKNTNKNTKVLITYSFSLYLIILPTELFESAQFLKSNCAHRCMELFRITSAVVFWKHPWSAVNLRGEFKISWCDLTDRKHCKGISWASEGNKCDLRTTERAPIEYDVSG